MANQRLFPALVITRNSLRAQGSFAEAQAAFLEPDPASVARLSAMLLELEVGIVAHFYMDPELQGVIASTGYRHTQISDSLLMADRAVDMVRAGAKRIVVLGVDFMAENVRAVLDGAGFGDTPVYRVDEREIGCSLAQAAEAPEYLLWLDQASQTTPSLHVVYINTSLYTKAEAQRRIPTITCTSSNVVRTVLSAFAQVPELSVWFGPDTYMGQNLTALFETLAERPASEIAALHPQHDRQTIRALLKRFHFFPRGNCIVHHLFGDSVARTVKSNYADSYITAHLEVPGAMFRLGLDAQRAGRGIVGSTSDILNFVGHVVDCAVEQQGLPSEVKRVSFVLGTETGMVTSLVRRIQSSLERDTLGRIEVEIVFPVAEESVTATGQPDLPVIPGPMSGEGCSLEGGCATCPYMKMNSLDALFNLLKRIGNDETSLAAFAPRVRQGTQTRHPSLDIAVEPINHMREFTRDGRLSDALVMDVLSRNQP